MTTPSERLWIQIEPDECRCIEAQCRGRRNVRLRCDAVTYRALTVGLQGGQAPGTLKRVGGEMDVKPTTRERGLTLTLRVTAYDNGMIEVDGVPTNAAPAYDLATAGSVQQKRPCSLSASSASRLRHGVSRRPLSPSNSIVRVEPIWIT